MRMLITSLILITLSGCVNAPYRDDYTTHVNNISEHYGEKDIQFALVDGPLVDIRGIYSKDDETSFSPMMYQGGAGLAGLIAQIGAHASIIKSQRNRKLVDAQAKANDEISPLINMAKEMDLLALVDQAGSELSSPVSTGTSPGSVNIKPIFFASSSMDKISLNMVVWVGDTGSSGSDAPKYQNLIQVFSPRLSAQQSESLANGDKKLLSNIMASLLNTSLMIVKADLTGKYLNISSPDKTFLVDKYFGEKVVRGAVVDHICEYVVIRDIRSWFVAYTTDNSLASAINDQGLQESCTSKITLKDVSV